jgi:hypothetical protein
VSRVRPRIVVLAVLVATLASALAAPDGPPGVPAVAGWSLRPLLAVTSPLRLFAAGPDGSDEEAAAWRRAYLDERARRLELEETLRTIPDLRGLAENPLAADSLAEGTPRIILAKVIHHDATPLRNGILVEAGEEDDIVVGMPATVGNTLVGVVVRVWSGRICQVRLLDDPQTRLRAAVLVRDARDGTALRPGNLEGLGGGRLAMRFVRGPGVEEGTPVVTTADSWWIPPLLVAGILESVTDRDHDGVAEIRVRPAVRLDTLSVVALWRRPDPPPGPWEGER